MKYKSAEEVITARREKLRLRSGYISLFLRILLIAAAGYIVFTQLFYVTQISGQDMYPALKGGDLAVVFRLQQDYQKDDIVAYRTDEGVKFGRIAARGDDVITIDNTGGWLVNGTEQSGEILYPTYTQGALEYPYRVPANSLFLMGDYRTQATDSRTYGAVSMDDVIGKVITILRRRSL